MTLRDRTSINWYALLGILLLPAVLGGVLVAALYNPTERLDRMTAAIVNLDEPVTIDGQYTPLGRVLAAGLVEGTDELDSNLTWVISNETDAASGLDKGTYQAVVTIPAEFSAAATSAGQALAGADAPAVQAEISVVTRPGGPVADDLITGQIAAAAASAMGSALSEATFENVLIGFSTLGSELGTAADGAAEWADGAREASTGAVSLADGIAELSSGAAALASGSQDLSAGATGIADGAATLAQGASDAAKGLNTWAAGARELSSGTADLAAGLTVMADQLAALPEVPQGLIDAATALAGSGEEIESTISDAASRLQVLAETCAAEGGSTELCAALAEISAQTSDAMPTITEVAGLGSTLAQGAAELAQAGPALTQGLRASAEGATELAEGMSALATGASDAAAGVRALAGGMSGLSAGADDFAGGASSFADGAEQLASGAGTASEGTGELATGVGALADGADTLAEGLATAVDALPGLGDGEAGTLAAVVAEPVTAGSGASTIFGESAVPLLAAVVLWFGALASFLVLRPVAGSTLTARTGTAVQALRGFWPAAAVGAGQGVLVSLVVQAVVGWDAAAWWGFAGIAVLAGVAFAGIHQALVVALRGTGRFIAALVGVLALVAGLTSTVPAWLASLASALPTAPAFDGLVAPGGAPAAALVVWALLSLAVTALVLAVRRGAEAKAVLAAA